MYDDNGGSVAAIAGVDFCVIASDTRLIVDDIIMSRSNSSKLHILNDSIVLGGSGMKSDMDELHSIMDIQYKMYTTYNHKQKKSMSIQSASQLLSNVLYSRRFMPYYVSNVMGGIDTKTGQGVVYQYDYIGSFEKYKYRADGSGIHFLMPFLDSVIGNQNRTGQNDDVKNTVVELTKEQTVELLKEAFIAANQRDVLTGDTLDIMIVTKEDGIEKQTFSLLEH